eukprot:TRINITY_DN83228_c0_g1_i1.p1 TRINITY_DN83228_c0_g1~~TRINITY_DN83228_c0_g1_i1.p1  ORF type:complete len:171 (+),score=21.24 TRINITY_DN83228_c0_g1_i1:97-609(+)
MHRSMIVMVSLVTVAAQGQPGPREGESLGAMESLPDKVFYSNRECHLECVYSDSNYGICEDDYCKCHGERQIEVKGSCRLGQPKKGLQPFGMHHSPCWKACMYSNNMDGACSDDGECKCNGGDTPVSFSTDLCPRDFLEQQKGDFQGTYKHYSRRTSEVSDGVVTSDIHM